MSENTPHTPGPWIVDPEPLAPDDPTPVLRVRTDEKPAAWIARVSTWHVDDAPDAKKQAQANARLIAAAPDLFKVVAEVALLEPNSLISADVIRTAHETLKVAAGKVAGGTSDRLQDT